MHQIRSDYNIWEYGPFYPACFHTLAITVLLVFPLGAGLRQTSENVLIVVNRSANVSRRIADYYVQKRSIPLANICGLALTSDEEIPRDLYENQIERPIASFLKSRQLVDKILYIVTTLGLPLKIAAADSGPGTEASSVDSELTLLYARMKGMNISKAGGLNNPFFRQKDQSFEHPRFPIYLVTRLAGYDFADVKGLIDRSLAAGNRGKFIFDLKSNDDQEGNNWLRAAAKLLPGSRVVLEQSEKVLYDQKEVIGYAGWGSNDPHRTRRTLGFEWLPGAIVTEFVSTNGRTFQRPPPSWTITTWKDTQHWFAGSPQTLTADYIHEGATGCSGHVYEPFLAATPRPEYLFPAYFGGRNLAESYYLSIPALSWQNIVVGDPLCRLGKSR